MSWKLFVIKKLPKVKLFFLSRFQPTHLELFGSIEKGVWVIKISLFYTSMASKFCHSSTIEINNKKLHLSTVILFGVGIHSGAKLRSRRADMKAFIQFFTSKSVTVTPLRSHQGSLKMATRKYPLEVILNQTYNTSTLKVFSCS